MSRERALRGPSAGLASILRFQVRFHLACPRTRRPHRFTEFFLRDAETLLPISDLVRLVYVNAGLVAVVSLLRRVETAHLSFSCGATLSIAPALSFSDGIGPAAACASASGRAPSACPNTPRGARDFQAALRGRLATLLANGLWVRGGAGERPLRRGQEGQGGQDRGGRRASSRANFGAVREGYGDARGLPDRNPSRHGSSLGFGRRRARTCPGLRQSAAPAPPSAALAHADATYANACA